MGSHWHPDAVFQQRRGKEQMAYKTVKTHNLIQNKQEIRELAWLFPPVEAHKDLLRESHIFKSKHLFKFISTLTEGENI